MPAGSAAAQRSANLALVMRALNRGEATTRSRLADLLRLDRSTMTHLVGHLVDAGVVEERQPGAGAGAAELTFSPDSPRPPARVGRPPVQLRLRHDRLIAGGIELTSEHYRTLVVDNAGSVLLRDRGPNPDCNDPARAIAMLYHKVSSDAAAASLPLFAIGAALSGIVDPHNARLVHSEVFGVHDVDLLQHIEPHSARAALVFDNDANCGAWGELHIGRHSDRDFVFLLGRQSGNYLGVGMGLAIDGAVYYGRRYRAGEFISVAAARGGDSQFRLPRRELLRARGNRAVMQRLLCELLQSLGPLITALDPTRVVLGGVLRGQARAIDRLLHGELAHSSSAASCNALPFTPSYWNQDEVTAGAAGMVLEKLFNAPRTGRSGGRDVITWQQLFSAVGAVA